MPVFGVFNLFWESVFSPAHIDVLRKWSLIEEQSNGQAKAVPTFPNSSTLISPSLSQSNKAKASFRQSMSLAVTCLSGLTLRAGGLAIRGRRRSSAHNGGKPSTGQPQPGQLTSQLLAADVPPPQRSFPIHTHNARLDICQKITPQKNQIHATAKIFL